jgi:hypothetical protein
MPANHELKEHYDKHGYAIIPDLVTASEHANLLASTERVVARTRSGSWPHARVVGKQFPPYGIGDDIWGVQHAMHPALGEPIFARWYAGDAVRRAARVLLGCRDDELQMGEPPPPPPPLFSFQDQLVTYDHVFCFVGNLIELFNILVNPAHSEFALCWHRDDIKGSASEEEERAALAVRHYGVCIVDIFPIFFLC